MKHFGTLYLFEWKKLLGKRIVWISFLLVLLMLAIAVFSPLIGGYYIDGKYMGTTYEMHQTDRAYAKTLNGRKIDQNLLEETIEAYRKIPKDLDIHYMATDEYQKYARPYSEIFVFLRQMTGMMTSELMYSWEPDENDLSAKRRAYLLSYWKEQRLSAGEIEFWSSLENQIKTPYIYQEHGGYDIIFSCYQGIGFFMLMLIGISLSGSLRMNIPKRPIRSFCAAPWGKQDYTVQRSPQESAFPCSAPSCCLPFMRCALSAYTARKGLEPLINLGTPYVRTLSPAGRRC